MTAIMIKSSVVTMLRRRERAASSGAGRPADMMVSALSRMRHDLQCLLRARCSRFEQQRSGRRDHAPGTVECALAQLEAEQAVALARAGQGQLAGLDV